MDPNHLRELYKMAMMNGPSGGGGMSSRHLIQGGPFPDIYMFSALPIPKGIANSETLIDMIKSRLRLRELPFEIIVAHQIGEDYVVFLVYKGQHLTLTDTSLFPSDQLITQLRVLLE